MAKPRMALALAAASFAEHTDSALLTLSLLCPGAAGLEVCDASVSSDAADDAFAAALEELFVHAELDVRCTSATSSPS